VTPRLDMIGLHVWGQHYAIVRDPDGNDVALFAAPGG
jgi:hypothetical protein